MIFRDWEEYDLFQPENLITNGNFPDNVDGWNVPWGASISWENGYAHFSQNSSYLNAYQDIQVTPGVSYEFSVDITDETIQGRAFLSDSGGGNSDAVTSANKSITFTPQSNSVRVYIGGLDGAGVCMFDNVILKPA